MLPEDRDTEDFTIEDVLETLTLELRGGTKLTTTQAKEALDEAMEIIEAIGTTGIYSRYGKAHRWMKRYYPNWA